MIGPWNEADVEPALAEGVQYEPATVTRNIAATAGYPYFLRECGKRVWNVAKFLGKGVTSQGPARQSLINKGMIWSPSHGATAFTVPHFDEFMKRIVPGNDWRE